MNKPSLLLVAFLFTVIIYAQKRADINEKILNQLGVKLELTSSFTNKSEVAGVYSISISNGFGTRIALSSLIFSGIPITEDEYEKAKNLGRFSDAMFKGLIKGTLILYPNGLALIRTKQKTVYLNWKLDSKNHFLKINSKEKDIFPINRDLIIEPSDSEYLTGYYCNNNDKNCLPILYFKKKEGNSNRLLKEELHLMKTSPWVKSLDENLFSRKLFFHEQISMKIPKELSHSIKKNLKPSEGQIPLLAISQEGLSLSVEVSNDNYSDNKRVLEQKNNILEGLKSKYPNGKVLSNSVLKINNRNLGMIDITISQKKYLGIYRLFFVTHCNYRTVYGVFTCAYLKREKWIPIFKEMVKSIEITEK